MKSKNSIIGWAFILSIIMVLLLLGDFLALHDINQDYVSLKVLDDIPTIKSDEIPDWASTRMEWTFVRISLLLKVIIAPLIVIALAKSVKMLRL